MTYVMPRVIRPSLLTLTKIVPHASILTLPTIGFNLVDGVPGYWIVPVQTTIQNKITVAYGGINAAATLGVMLNNNAYMTYPVRQNQATSITNLLGVSAGSCTRGVGVPDGTFMPYFPLAVNTVGFPLQLWAGGNGGLNFTGGILGNQLSVTTLYYLEKLL